MRGRIIAVSMTVLLGLALVGLGIYMVGCGQQETATTTTASTTTSTTTTTTGASTTTTSTTTTTSGDTTTTTTTTTSTTTPTIADATFSITGSFNTGSIAGAGISATGIRAQASAFAAAADYTLAAVDEDGLVYYAESATDAQGTFIIPEIPAGKSIHLTALDSDNRLAAPIAFGTDNSEVVMAINSPATTDEAIQHLGQIVYEAEKGTAVPTVAPSSILSDEDSDKVTPKDGETFVPKGALNFGKGETAQFEGAYDSTKIDGDKDGLPNPLDADNNGDLVLDNFDGLATKETMASADTKIGYATMWTNLKIPYGSTVADQVNAPTGYWVTISITPKEGYTITSVTLEAGPSWVDNAKIHQSNHADGGSYWQAVGYQLYSPPDTDSFLLMLGGAEIAPGTIVKAGDTLTFIVTFDDSSTEKITKMINFAIGDIAKLQGYVYRQYTSTGEFSSQYLPDGMANTLLSENPVDNNVFSLKWQKATDESGAYLEGASYIWEVGEGNYVTPIVTTEIGSAYVYGYSDLNLEVLLTAETFGCGIGMRSTIGDNAVQNATYAKTTSWGTTELESTPNP